MHLIFSKSCTYSFIITINRASIISDIYHIFDLIYDSMFLLIIQSTMFNVYNISIITRFTASTACVGYKITLTTIKLIEFISIYVNLTV